jgi:hypothetical protein
VALGVPLVIVGLLAYSCSSPSPVTNPKAASSPTAHPAASQSKLITPGPQVSGTVAPPNSYPVTGPTGSSSASAGASGGAGGASGGSGGTGGGNGGSGTLSGAGAGCVLDVSVSTDKTAANGVPQYSSGQDPTIKVTLQNKGTANCLVPAGGVVVTVTSISSTGSQQIVWNSSACQSTSGSEMAIGSNPVTVPIPWQRIDNASSCPGTSAAASGQLYEATASALGVTSTPAQFELD